MRSGCHSVRKCDTMQFIMFYAMCKKARIRKLHKYMQSEARQRGTLSSLLLTTTHLDVVRTVAHSTPSSVLKAVLCAITSPSASSSLLFFRADHLVVVDSVEEHTIRLVLAIASITSCRLLWWNVEAGALHFVLDDVFRNLLA